MVYMETIEESKAWTCPKSGIWKVICVGGGGAGYFSTRYGGNTEEHIIYSKGEAGTATSFGSLLVADGGENGEKTATNRGFSGSSASSSSSYLYNPSYGINGYNGASCYGAACALTIGCGYGASGGVITLGSANIPKSSAGMPGKVLSKILDISEGDVIACTIGTGGKASETNNNNVYNYGRALPGRDGAIIVQYLGSEM